MKSQWRCLLIWSLLLVGLPTIAFAAPPWGMLSPFKRVEANPRKSYVLQQGNGPWVILATTFQGETAEKQAHKLVLELRERYQLTAYVHSKEYDYTKTVQGLGIDRFGKPKRMRHLRAEKFEEVAVLVGDFETFDDPRAQSALKKIKAAWPKSLQIARGSKSAQQFADLRRKQQQANKRLQKEKGPMRTALITRNPLLPAEYFAPRGLDPLVIEMNKHVEHSLLDCKKPYSLRIARFRGNSTMEINEIKKLKHGAKTKSKLAEAAEKAHRLTGALRKLGYDAYEFHDRHESIVTVGAFKSVGQPRPDGKIEINPAVHQLMQAFKARVKNLNGFPGAVMPHIVEGIMLDPQPLPIQVPRASIATDYKRQNFFR